MVRWIACAAAWILAGLAAAPPAFAGAAAAEPTVVLLSFDGTRPADLRSDALPTFARLLREGAAAERMDPVFPTNTFPNHASLVTGVAPERHGIVNNVFLDPERGLFDYAADPTWFEAPPLWSLLAAHGVPSASFHWVGSEGSWRDGTGPLEWKRFDARTPADVKVEQILVWLDRPPGPTRPRFVSAWFRGADHEGHRHGPGSAEAARDLAAQDASLGRLVAGIERRGLFSSTTLLVVSDHGMARVERAVDLASELREAGVHGRRILAGGGFAIVHLMQAAQADRATRVARTLGLEAFERRTAPRELRLGNDRFGDVVVFAPVGTAFLRDSLRQRIAARLHLPGASLGGAHGYRPEEESMGAIFVAFGRGAAPGAKLGRVSALDVAPTVLALLGVPADDGFEGAAIPALHAPAPAAEAAREGTGR
jgi:arylsulfatase A-like enzyme